MSEIKKGKYIREKTECPDCGKLCFLPMHINKCPGKNNNDEIEKTPDVKTSSEIEIIESEETDFPLLDENFGAALKRNAEKVARHIKGGKPISKKNFGELLQQTNKIFIFFEMPEYCMTQDDLDLILDDLYYLIGKYFPDFLKYLSNDLIVVARLISRSRPPTRH